jgi:hypothetical protein
VEEYYWDDLTSPKSHLSAMLTSVYKERVERFKRASDMTKQLRGADSRNGGYDYRSFRFDQRILNAKQELDARNSGGSVVIDEITAMRDLRLKMESLNFDPDEPEMMDEAMLMVITLLRHFDEQESKAIRRGQDNGGEYSACGEETDDDDITSSELSSSTTASRLKQRPRRTAANSSNQFPRIIDGLAEERGSVLIFVPGMNQIKSLQELITSELPNAKLNILPLHSDIVIDQQQRVFLKSESTWRKVIISTKIAESSITVPDVKYVIDFGLAKELYCDPSTNYTHLREELAFYFWPKFNLPSSEIMDFFPSRNLSVLITNLKKN